MDVIFDDARRADESKGDPPRNISITSRHPLVFSTVWESGQAARLLAAWKRRRAMCEHENPDDDCIYIFLYMLRCKKKKGRKKSSKGLSLSFVYVRCQMLWLYCAFLLLSSSFLTFSHHFYLFSSFLSTGRLDFSDGWFVKSIGKSRSFSVMLPVVSLSLEPWLRPAIPRIRARNWLLSTRVYLSLLLLLLPLFFYFLFVVVVRNGSKKKKKKESLGYIQQPATRTCNPSLSFFLSFFLSLFIFPPAASTWPVATVDLIPISFFFFYFFLFIIFIYMIILSFPIGAAAAKNRSAETRRECARVD